MALARVRVEQPVHRAAPLGQRRGRRLRVDPHRRVVLRARVQSRFVGLDDRDEVVAVLIANAFEPAHERKHGREDLADERRIAGRVVDPLDRARDDRRLDRPGIERTVQADARLRREPLGILAGVPQEHVPDVPIGLRSLHEAAQLLLREIGVDLQQRDRVEGAVPEPLKWVVRRRRAHEVVVHAVPFRGAGAPVGRQDATRFGGDAAGELGIDAAAFAHVRAAT